MIIKTLVYLMVLYSFFNVGQIYQKELDKKELDYQTMRHIVIMDWLDGQNKKWHYWANKEDKQKFEDWVNYAAFDRLRAIKGENNGK